MRNWLRNKLHRFLYPQDEVVAMNKLSTTSRNEGIDMDNCLRFNVLSCQGGIVVQLHKYDHKKDRSDNSTYVIPDHEDVTKRIAEIVSLELLKN